MALGKPSESFVPKAEAQKVAPKSIDARAQATALEAQKVLGEQVEASDKLSSLSADIELGLSTEQLDRVKNLKEGKDFLSNAEKAESIEPAPPEVIRGAGSALLAELQSSERVASMGGAYMESAIASV